MSEQNLVRTIASAGLDIMAIIDWVKQDPHTVFHPSNLLLYVVKGTLHVSQGNHTHVIPPGGFLLARKYTECLYQKTWTAEEGHSVLYGFLLYDEYIRARAGDIPETLPPKEVLRQDFFVLPSNEVLKGLFGSVVSYLEKQQDLDPDLVSLKTHEALMGVFKASPFYRDLLIYFARPERAELTRFMEHSYLYRVSIEDLAKMSGRSVSTFNREFKTIFGESPHKWIMKKRLEKAMQLLQHTPRKASEIYLEVGFTDLSHFSRSFKKHYDINPSQVRKTDPVSPSPTSPSWHD
ncbi:MAG: AraC family transcriptional regulator [Bacteroidota bacterium]